MFTSMLCILFSMYSIFNSKNKRKCLIKKGKSRKGGKVNGNKDVISHRTSDSPAGDIGESFRHLEYCILSAMMGGLASA